MRIIVWTTWHGTSILMQLAGNGTSSLRCPVSSCLFKNVSVLRGYRQIPSFFVLASVMIGEHENRHWFRWFSTSILKQTLGTGQASSFVLFLTVYSKMRTTFSEATQESHLLQFLWAGFSLDCFKFSALCAVTDEFIFCSFFGLVLVTIAIARDHRLG